MTSTAPESILGIYSSVSNEQQQNELLNRKQALLEMLLRQDNNPDVFYYHAWQQFRILLSYFELL